MTEAQSLAVAQAFHVLRAAMQEDAGYAWSWQCNLAMSFYDVGGNAVVGNKAAARFLSIAFGIDVTTYPQYQELMKD